MKMQTLILTLGLALAAVQPGLAQPTPAQSAPAHPHANPHAQTQPPAHPHGNPHAQPQVPIKNEEPRFLRNVHQLTFEGRRSGEGYFSRDGRRMIFQSEREAANPFYQIYLLDLGTGASRRVSPGTGKTTCSWIHPDGKRVLFASTHLDPDAARKQKDELEFRKSGQKKRYAWDYDEHYEIFEVPVKGGAARNLTKARGYDAEGSWSPDGRLIAFASNRHAYANALSQDEAKRFSEDPSSQMDIYVMNADGSSPRRLTRMPGYDGGPFFSPDGKRICWRHFSLDGRVAEVYTMAVDGSDARQITRLGAMSWAPYFHPAGDYMIFATNLQGYGNFELYIVDSAGRGKPVRVTCTDGFDGLPVFTPDGRRLAWTSSRTGNGQSQIFMADWDDAAARRALGLAARTWPQAKAAPATIDAARTRQHVEKLASDEMDGRLTGTPGEARAATYIAAAFKALGLEPAGDRGTYLQAFPFTAGVKLGPGNRLTMDGAPLTVDRDWRPLAFSKSGPVEAAEVVFAGYGIVAPEEAADAGPTKWGYDSYAGLDVNGKWVVVFRFQPENVPPEQRQRLSRFASLRYKAMAARDRGARGLIVVTGPNASVKDQLVKLNVDATLAGSSLPAISVTDEAGGRILAGRPLKGLQDALDTGKAVPGFAISTPVAATVDIVQEKRTGHNVVARLRAHGKATGRVIIGAHYDHLGRGSDSSSLARASEKGRVHHGADDNASGVAGLLEIARMLSAHRSELKRDVVFAAWSGEELGILGSSWYAKNAARPDVIAYLNMDMIGRMRDNVVLYGIGSSSWWLGAVERANAPLALAVTARDESYLPTDATSFYIKQIPILSAFTGAHAEYHSPRDVAARINYPSLARIATLLGRVALELASTAAVPDYRRMEKPVKSETRANLRAWLGTIPDYAQGGSGGVKISGVAAKGPADTAGMQAGDVIVEVAGRKIDNIYDYTYAIEGLKVGVPVQIAVVRSGQRMDLTVTPTSRE